MAHHMDILVVEALLQVEEASKEGNLTPHHPSVLVLLRVNDPTRTPSPVYCDDIDVLLE